MKLTQLFEYLETLDSMEAVAFLNTATGYFALAAIITDLFRVYLDWVMNDTPMSKDERTPILIVAGLFFVFPWQPIKIVIFLIFFTQLTFYTVKHILDKLIKKLI